MAQSLINLENDAKHPRIKPTALGEGDNVGIIAPAGPIERELLDAGCAVLRTFGYHPVYLDSILERDGYFAGSVKRRVDEFHEMFRRDDVRAIICARGGYGCNYLLPEIDLDVVRNNPKMLVGYSDVTSLLTYISDATGLTTMHGPMVTKDFAREGGVDEASWRAAVSGWVTQLEFPEGSEVVPLARGFAQGRLYGGCISMLAASLGTPYEIQTDGTILFIEDVAAHPYQVDRMLMQLKLAGKLDGVRGIVFGVMKECDATPGNGYSLQEIVARIVGDLTVPVAYGLRSGHVDGGNMTLPIGVQAVLQVQEDVRLGWEPGVVADASAKQQEDWKKSVK